MKLLTRVSGLLKDQTSIWLASFSKRTALRNPDIEAAVIKSTSHDESRLDYHDAQRVFAWVRISPAYLKPLLWAIASRMHKTGSWAVALKGLLLVHGVFCCQVPAVQRIGRLPFDLSSFKDRHTKRGESWGFNAFIRAYYSFLDHKSSFMLLHKEEQHKGQQHSLVESREHGKSLMMKDLVLLQEMQDLLDMLLLIKPNTKSMVGALILEAMDCVVIEILDVYSGICSGIAKVLNMIYTAGKVEALMALKVLQKAAKQGDELSLYFQFCREIGVMNAAVHPQMQQIPEEDIKILEQIIDGVPEKRNYREMAPYEETKSDWERLRTQIGVEQDSTSKNLKTIITNQWQEFNEVEHTKNDAVEGKVVKAKEEHQLPLIPVSDLQVYGNSRVVPDLISF